ncbi:MAG TPA: prephenate dehydratase domain-containing protein, partial [Solirubrobacterales bacterium]|nr:prephenate dehydratase domain-containing protein [Solirubrobacterales bacterium]
MRIAYLGPAGTFTEDALGEALPDGGYEPLRLATIHDAILAVERGEADRALVPIENSLEGSVRPTLDALAFEVSAVTIVGEHDY